MGPVPIKFTNEIQPLSVYDMLYNEREHSGQVQLISPWWTWSAIPYNVIFFCK